MGEPLSEYELGRLSELISTRLGLYFPRERWVDMQKKTEAAAFESGAPDLRAFLEGLFSGSLSRETIQRLAGSLTVGETYFFRERPSFEALRETILPELIRRRAGQDKLIRIWSAGCATGEEPYSLAILLKSLELEKLGCQATILATDLNTGALESARRGEYRRWSFRDPAAPPSAGCFEEMEGEVRRVARRIREMVQFDYLNLAEDCYPSLLGGTNALDLILCRNVLMYFSPQRQREVISRFLLCLRPGGWLLVSPCEASAWLFSEFDTVSLPQMSAFRKPEPGTVKPAAAVQRQAAGRKEAPHPSRATARKEEPAGKEREAAAKPPASPEPAPGSRAVGEVGKLFQAGDYAAVVERLATVPTPEPAGAICLIKSLANLGELGRSLELCRSQVEQRRLDPALHYLLAMLLVESGQGAEAAAELGRTLYLEPGHALAHFALGRLAFQAGQRTQAEKHLRNCLAALQRLAPDQEVAESDGLTAGRLERLISQMLPQMSGQSKTGKAAGHESRKAKG
ncbi:chemotaxis protein CheR [bacterium]|nr:chemotaxis protein CheR [bacterium]